MILPGRAVFTRQIVHGLLSAKSQVPCGIDLSLKRVLAWTSAGTVDFDNTHRKTADTTELPFEKATGPDALGSELRMHLGPGAYLVEFSETIDVPLDVMGELFVRSSLFRSGALVSAGVMDSGYKGAIDASVPGGMLQVVNPHGLTLFKNAKLAQFVFHQMMEKVEGYSGVYQNKAAM
ncbi:deoxyuridine 5'-triphosphate nucleotidohydrolase [Mycena belliarum]|uniref:Deoxyuridine 5'-triphosphate nucleotidohydrolase n=1 Tax=Mycena belliarum TaxID=1033014 RepID=A0AAD6XQJ7_9AGAR|nr:deoxyuridine 5'-triphosphate nucleotidohydrolase [Mycena belliae]